jgi:hypothetical protein
MGFADCSGRPPLYEEFSTKRWALLWRGSRDGFSATEFHRRCDSRANILTLILDTDGNVFGGFTPVKWEPRMVAELSDNCLKGDDSLRRFLLALKNPHKQLAQKSAFTAENKQSAIFGSATFLLHSDWQWTPNGTSSQVRRIQDHRRNDSSSKSWLAAGAARNPRISAGRPH